MRNIGQQNGRSDLSISAPGRWVARMPGTGSPRGSSTPARIKAIVGKSRVGATRVTAFERVDLRTTRRSEGTFDTESLGRSCERSLCRGLLLSSQVCRQIIMTDKGSLENWPEGRRALSLRAIKIDLLLSAVCLDLVVARPELPGEAAAVEEPSFLRLSAENASEKEQPAWQRNCHSTIHRDPK